MEIASASTRADASRFSYRSAELRYVGQDHPLLVEIPRGNDDRTRAVSRALPLQTRPALRLPPGPGTRRARPDSGLGAWQLSSSVGGGGPVDTERRRPAKGQPSAVRRRRDSTRHRSTSAQSYCRTTSRARRRRGAELDDLRAADRSALWSNPTEPLHRRTGKRVAVMRAAVDVDPITREVVQNRLISIVREMSLTLQRAAYSPIIYEVKDFSSVLLAPDASWSRRPRVSPPSSAQCTRCSDRCSSATRSTKCGRTMSSSPTIHISPTGRTRTTSTSSSLSSGTASRPVRRQQGALDRHRRQGSRKLVARRDEHIPGGRQHSAVAALPRGSTERGARRDDTREHSPA